MSLHSNTYQVDPALAGRRVELVFDPFDMTDIAVRHHGKPFGTAVPHQITRHSHPKARPETVDAPAAPTGIDYLNLVADAHHARAGAAISSRTGHRARPGPRQPATGMPATQPGRSLRATTAAALKARMAIPRSRPTLPARGRSQRGARAAQRA